MCNLSKGVEEQGIQKGLEQGIQAMIATLKKLQIPTETILIEICEKLVDKGRRRKVFKIMQVPS